MRRALLDLEDDVAPDHERGEALLRRVLRVGGPDDATVAQHGDAVGDLEHLAQLVRDEHDRLALVDEAADDAEELVDLARREHRGRLVEDEDVGLAEQRLQQLDALLLADRQVLDRARRDRRRGRTARPSASMRSRAVSRSSTGPRRSSSPSTTFSATVNTGISWKCWCTMPMPAAIASDELPKCDGSPSSRISPASGW